MTYLIYDLNGIDQISRDFYQPQLDAIQEMLKAAPAELQETLYTMVGDAFDLGWVIGAFEQGTQYQDGPHVWRVGTAEDTARIDAEKEAAK